jgi:hypothetical protein
MRNKIPILQIDIDIPAFERHHELEVWHVRVPPFFSSPLDQPYNQGVVDVGDAAVAVSTRSHELILILILKKSHSPGPGGGVVWPFNMATFKFICF